MALKSLKRFLNDGTKNSFTVMILKRLLNVSSKGLKSSLSKNLKKFLNQGSEKVP